MPVWAAVMLSLKAEVTGDGTDLPVVSGGLKKLKLVENSAGTGHSRRYQTDAIWEY